MGIDFSKRAVTFYQNNGLVFFNKFEALNSRMKPVKLQITEPKPITTIRVENLEGSDLGTFDITIDKARSTIVGRQLLSYEEREGNGQLLTLGAIMELAKNKMNKLTYFSGEKTIPFLTKLGFIIDNEDTRYIMNGLKQVIKSKMTGIEDIREKAKFYYPRLDILGDVVPDDKTIFKNSCRVLSDYIKLITRNNYPKKYLPYFDVGSDMKFSDWEIQTDRMYLNSLMDKHCLDFKF